MVLFRAASTAAANVSTKAAATSPATTTTTVAAAAANATVTTTAHTHAERRASSSSLSPPTSPGLVNLLARPAAPPSVAGPSARRPAQQRGISTVALRTRSAPHPSSTSSSSRSTPPPRAPPRRPAAPPSFARSFSASASRAATGTKDPYATLGVKRDASARDIKSAYYDLAKKYHPDTNKEKGAEKRFVEIQNAYDILSDEKKKAAYDAYGTTDGTSGFNPFGGGGGSPFGAGGGSPFGGFGGFAGAAGGATADDIFSSLFGSAFGGAGRARAGGAAGAGFAGETRGSDLETSVNISFEEACKGTSRTVTITPVEGCATCRGSGLKAGARKSSCPGCGGTGTRTFVIQSGFQMASTCPQCGGTGTTTRREDECADCDGVGRVRGRRTLEVKIPAGVDDGAKIRMDGAGDAPLQGSGPSGSLFVRIGVRPSRVWRRQGANLYYPATIPLHAAVLGGKVRVPTLEGDVEVRVPQGTQVGDEMLLRGRGVPHLVRRGGGDKGDLLVQFEVQIPRSLTRRQRELLQAYADEVEGRSPPTPPTPPPQSKPPPSPASSASPAQPPPPSSASSKGDERAAPLSTPQAKERNESSMSSKPTERRTGLTTDPTSATSNNGGGYGAAAAAAGAAGRPSVSRRSGEDRGSAAGGGDGARSAARGDGGDAATAGEGGGLLGRAWRWLRGGG